MKVYKILSQYCSDNWICPDTLELAMQYLKMYIFSNWKERESSTQHQSLLLIHGFIALRLSMKYNDSTEEHYKMYQKKVV